MFTTVTPSFACLCPRQTGDCTCIETVTGKLVTGGLVTGRLVQSPITNHQSPITNSVIKQLFQIQRTCSRSNGFDTPSATQPGAENRGAFFNS